jgi:hypothetical protein
MMSNSGISAVLSADADAVPSFSADAPKLGRAAASPGGTADDKPITTM